MLIDYTVNTIINEMKEKNIKKFSLKKGYIYFEYYLKLLDNNNFVIKSIGLSNEEINILFDYLNLNKERKLFKIHEVKF